MNTKFAAILLAAFACVETRACIHGNEKIPEFRQLVNNDCVLIGCNPLAISLNRCICLEPLTECNTSAGVDVLGIHEGVCELAALSYVLVAIPLAFIACCCICYFKAELGRCCCPDRRLNKYNQPLLASYTQKARAELATSRDVSVNV